METVVIGSRLARLASELQEALRAAGVKVHSFGGPKAARVTMVSQLSTGPSSVFVQVPAPDLGEFVAWLRGRPDLMAVPLVLVAERGDRASWRKARELGADDVIELGDLPALRARAEKLRGLDPGHRPPASSGHVVLLDQDRNRRRIVGRTMRQAGFEVSFASHRGELLRAVDCALELKVLVLEESDPSTSLELVSTARQIAQNPLLPALILRAHPASDARSDTMTGVQVVPIETGVDALLFYVNELLHKEVQEARSSRRLLTDIPCEFRLAGHGPPIAGVTYNISREGIFVRSLAYPPPGGQVWLELALPNHGRVHLRADVVWACKPGAGPRTAPPGFAVRVAEASCPPGDLVVYQRCYDELLMRWDGAAWPSTFSVADPFHNLPRHSTEAA